MKKILLLWLTLAPPIVAMGQGVAVRSNNGFGTNTTLRGTTQLGTTNAAGGEAGSLNFWSVEALANIPLYAEDNGLTLDGGLSALAIGGTTGTFSDKITGLGSSNYFAGHLGFASGKDINFPNGNIRGNGITAVGNWIFNSGIQIDSTVTWGDGVRQTFNPNGTTPGFNVGSQAGNPSTPSNGDLWYNSSANELTARINGANVALGAGGSGGLPGTNTVVAYGDLFRTNDLTVSTNGTTVTGGVLGGEINSINLKPGSSSGLFSHTATLIDFRLSGDLNVWDATVNLQKWTVNDQTSLVLAYDAAPTLNSVYGMIVGTGSETDRVNSTNSFQIGSPILNDDFAFRFSTNGHFYARSNIVAGGSITAGASDTFGTIQMGTAGMTTAATNGSFTLQGIGDGQDENLDWDFNTTANTVGVSSRSGVTVLNLVGISPKVNGALIATQGLNQAFTFSNNVTVRGTLEADALTLGTLNTTTLNAGTLVLTNSANLRTNIGAMDVSTNAFVIGTRYTNTTRRAFVSASFALTAAAAGTAAVRLYVENGTTITNKLEISAGPLASLVTVEPLMQIIPPDAKYGFVDITSGTGASVAIVAGTSSKTDF